jgi:hypothetical protein
MQFSFRFGPGIDDRDPGAENHTVKHPQGPAAAGGRPRRDRLGDDWSPRSAEGYGSIRQALTARPRAAGRLAAAGGQNGGMTPDGFPPGFFERADSSTDGWFYSWPRLVYHIDDHAVALVGQLYDDLGIDGEVLDLMASWVSHFRHPPRHLTVLGMNAYELDANPAATARIVHDLNDEPRLPFLDESFDAAVCCVSVDYLIHPVEVFADVARVLRPGAPFVCSFSNRCFPSKAIRGWLSGGDEQHGEIVKRYFDLSGPWTALHRERLTPINHGGDPLFAVWAKRS